MMMLLNLLLFLFERELILQSFDVVLYRLWWSAAVCLLLFTKLLLLLCQLLLQISNSVHQLSLLVFDSLYLLGASILVTGMTQTNNPPTQCTSHNSALSLAWNSQSTDTIHLTQFSLVTGMAHTIHRPTLCTTPHATWSLYIVFRKNSTTFMFEHIFTTTA